MTLFLAALIQVASADAVCNDGWYSHSTGSGTCSHHGGVAYWVTPSKSPDSYTPYVYRPKQKFPDLGELNERILDIYSAKNPELFLGCLTCDPNHDSTEIRTNSVWNVLGKYNFDKSGSIWGVVGLSQYMDTYNAESICNKKATNPPLVVARTGHAYVGRLTLNTNLSGAILVPEVQSMLHTVCNPPRLKMK